ncbi:hypothetical protein F5884DRAFT_789915 [Xylogone sp. PMI_703]|nr:hypothetical protein F5884DRAFT_789915 [Xylogone sp. PMI_703]
MQPYKATPLRSRKMPKVGILWACETVMDQGDPPSIPMKLLDGGLFYQVPRLLLNERSAHIVSQLCKRDMPKMRARLSRRLFYRLD